MKVKDLKVHLEQFDEDLDVYIACSGYGNLMKGKSEDIHIEAVNVGTFSEPYWKDQLVIISD